MAERAATKGMGKPVTWRGLLWGDWRGLHASAFMATLWVTAGWLGACSHSASDATADDPGPEPKPYAGIDEDAQQYLSASASLFDRARRYDVELELPAGDFWRIGTEGRGLAAIGCDRSAAPSDFSYTWFTSTITVDGERFTEAAVRKKGFLGSLSIARPALKVDLARFELWARQVIVDASAADLGGVTGDLATMEWIRERFSADAMVDGTLAVYHAVGAE